MDIMNIINEEIQEEKKYSEEEILKIFNNYLQVSGKPLRPECKTVNMLSGCTLYEGEIILIESEIIFPTAKAAKVSVIEKYLQQNSLFDFTTQRKKTSAPKINSICNENPKNMLDTFLSRKNIIPTLEFISPDYTYQISLTYEEKKYQSKSPQSTNKKTAQYEASKDMLKQLSFVDEEAMKLYRNYIDKNYFRYGSSVDFTENDLIEFKASEICKVPEWGREDLRGTLDGIGKQFRSFAHYICAFLNSKKGGTIYYGIHDLGQAYGYILSEKDRDLILQYLAKQTNDLFFPALDKNLFSFYFHPVEVEEAEDEVNELLKKSENPPKDWENSSPSIREYIKNIRRENNRLKKTLKQFAPHRNIKLDDEVEKRFILEISVAKNEMGKVYWYNGDAFEKNENAIGKMRPEVISSRLLSHKSQSQPLLN